MALARILSGSTALSLVLAAGANAADLVISPEVVSDQPVITQRPAVSGINGKLEISYNSLGLELFPDHIHSYQGVGSISFPLAHSYGLQIDGGLASFDTGTDTATVGGIGAHLFWRDPGIGLLGVYGHFVGGSSGTAGFHNVRLGVEGEYYLDQWSFEGFVGADFYDNTAGDETQFYGEAIAAYYLTDNFRVQAGVLGRRGDFLGTVGAEYLLPYGANNVSLFASGAFGDDENVIKGGLRIYFGEQGKSLIARHREDDPKTHMFDFFGAPTVAGPAGCPPGFVEIDGFCVPLPT